MRSFLFLVCECGDNFQSPGGLASHRKFCEESSLKSPKYKCKCGDTFKNRGHLKMHKKYCEEYTNEKYQGQTKNPIIKKKCPVCNTEFETRKGGSNEKTYCSISCSNEDRTHSEETKNKISNSLKKDRVIRECKYEGCNEEFNVLPSSEQKYCSVSCAGRANWDEENKRKNLVRSIRKRFENPKEKQRMARIGKKGVQGRFGKTGETENRTYYHSSIEKRCFEYLESKDIKFENHKTLPKCGKMTDVYLNNFNIWVEIDGIGRERLKELGYDKEFSIWKQKLKIYEEENLQFEIVKSFEEFKSFIQEVNNN